MKQYCGFILLILLWSCNQKTTQNHLATNDSVKKYLNLAKDETLDFATRINYNDIAYSYIDTTRNDSVTRNDLYKVSLNYNKFWKYSKSLNPANSLLKFSFSEKDSMNIGNAYKCLGRYYMMDSKNEIALEYFFKAKNIFSRLHLIEKELNISSNIALTQTYSNDYLGSLKTYFEILNVAKKNNLKKEENSVYIEIGNLFTYLKKYEDALKYYNKYISKNKSSFYILNNNIAATYLDINDTINAFKFLNKNIDNDPTINPLDMAINKNIFGLYYFQTQNLKKCLENLKKAENIFNQIEATSGLNYNQIYLSQYYQKTKNIPMAINYAKKAVATSKGYKNPNDVLLSLNQLIKVDKQNASLHAQEYIRINDSLQKAERNFRDKYAQIIYETEEIKEQKESAVKKQYIIAGFSTSALLIGLLLFVIVKQRNNRVQLQLEQENQKANEEIYQLMLNQKSSKEIAKEAEKKRIAKELHDGIMNKLASTRLNLSILSQKTDSQTIEKCIDHISNIYTIEQEIRAIAHDLNSDIFKEENSFISMLKEMTENLNENETTSFQLDLDEAIDWKNISSKIKINLYRIIQEAISNIHKHAKATKVVITFLLDESNLCLSITDNGVGFDTKKNNGGLGLNNMKNRVASLNGKITFTSYSNKQTSINIAVPI